VGFTEDYIDAWNSKDVDRFVGQFAPNGRYSDMSMHVTYGTEAELRRMFAGTLDSYKDYEFKHIAGTATDRYYAVEWTHTSRSKHDGNEYTVRAISAGELDENGKILENRDYWNPAHYPGGDPAALATEAAAWEQLVEGQES